MYDRWTRTTKIQWRLRYLQGYDYESVMIERYWHRPNVIKQWTITIVSIKTSESRCTRFRWWNGLSEHSSHPRRGGSTASTSLWFLGIDSRWEYNRKWIEPSNFWIRMARTGELTNTERCSCCQPSSHAKNEIFSNCPISCFPGEEWREDEDTLRHCYWYICYRPVLIRNMEVMISCPILFPIWGKL